MAVKLSPYHTNLFNFPYAMYWNEFLFKLIYSECFGQKLQKKGMQLNVT